MLYAAPMMALLARRFVTGGTCVLLLTPFACDAPGARRSTEGSSQAEARWDAGESSIADRGDAGASAVTATSGKARVPLDEAPAEGDVASLVRDAMARHAAQRRTLVVYVGATWCKPCQRFRAALESGKLDDRLPDMAFLTFDVDRDQSRLRADGYEARKLPLLALPAPDGAPSGKQIEGGIPGEATVDYFVTELQKMLRQS
jgi:hypothetical protein